MSSKYLGTAGEMIVAAQCSMRGLAVFKEIGDNSRIDLIVVDLDGYLHKVQVKCLNRDAHDRTNLEIRKSGPNGYRYHYSADDIEWFAVVDAPTGRVAWISIKEVLVNKHNFSLRHDPPSNGQVKNIRMFSDYEDFPFGR